MLVFDTTHYFNYTKSLSVKLVFKKRKNSFVNYLKSEHGLVLHTSIYFKECNN